MRLMFILQLMQYIQYKLQHYICFQSEHQIITIARSLSLKSQCDLGSIVNNIQYRIKHWCFVVVKYFFCLLDRFWLLLRYSIQQWHGLYRHTRIWPAPVPPMWYTWTSSIQVWLCAPTWTWNTKPPCHNRICSLCSGRYLKAYLFI